jgi:hypothetical protein
MFVEKTIDRLAQKSPYKSLGKNWRGDKTLRMRKLEAQKLDWNPHCPHPEFLTKRNLIGAPGIVHCHLTRPDDDFSVILDDLTVTLGLQMEEKVVFILAAQRIPHDCLRMRLHLKQVKRA